MYRRPIILTALAAFLATACAQPQAAKPVAAEAPAESTTTTAATPTDTAVDTSAATPADGAIKLTESDLDALLGKWSGEYKGQRGFRGQTTLTLTPKSIGTLGSVIEFYWGGGNYYRSPKQGVTAAMIRRDGVLFIDGWALSAERKGTTLYLKASETVSGYPTELTWKRTIPALPSETSGSEPAKAAVAPQIDYASFQVGDYMVFDQSDVGLMRTTVVKIEGDQYTFENREDEDGQGALMFHSIHTSDGKRLTWADGEASWRFEPHGCYRAIGTCVYDAVNASTGERYKNTVKGAMEGERHVWKRYYKGREVSAGWAEIDPETGLSALYENTGNSPVSGKLVRVVRANEAPLPDDLTIIPPNADVAPELAAFSGLWAGAWGGSLAGKLAVTEVNADGSVTAIYAWGNNPGRFEGGWAELTGQISGNRLTLTAFNSGAQASYQMSDEGVLNGTYNSDGEITRGVFRKAE